MSTEPVLTSNEILVMGFANRSSDSPHAIDEIKFARVIEQAVLQSKLVQAWKKDAERCAEYRQLLEGAAAVLANSAEEMEEGAPNECLAHEARSMAQTILFALPDDAAMENQL